MRLSILSAIFLFSLPGFAQVQKIQAETVIQDVTVFSSGARIERISTLSLPSGKTEISFGALSNQLEQPSIQLKANADISLLSVQATKDFLSERKIDQEEKKFNENISALQDKIELDSKMLAVYKNEEEMLLKNQAIGGSTGVKTAELKDALDLQRQRLTDIFQKQLEIQKRLAGEQGDASRMKAQLSEISRKKDSVNYIVTALVESKEVKNVTFHLSYNIKDAGWYSSYDIRIKEVNQPLQVLMHANIFQRSGETWKDVLLILSTGNPDDNATPSPLQPWMLGFFDPSITYTNLGVLQGAATGRVTNENGEPIVGASVMVRETGMGTVTDLNGFFRIEQFGVNNSAVVSGIGYEKREFAVRPGYFAIALKPSIQLLKDVVVTGYGTTMFKKDIVADKPFQEKKEEMQNVLVATQYHPTTVEFKIDEKYTVETDGKTTTIGIKQFDVPAIYAYLSAPKIDPSVYLTAKILNWETYDLQSGEASLYFEGSYLGKTYIDLGSVSDTLSLSLGKDNGVRISRRLIKEYSTKRFIGNNRTETKQFEITVKNTKQVSLDLIVNDQFPVSTTKEINVDDQKAPEAQVDKDNGIITWNITLIPGQEKKLALSYAVRYPKDKKVVLEK